MDLMIMSRDLVVDKLRIEYIDRDDGFKYHHVHTIEIPVWDILQWVMNK